jgi:aryl-alcohol dehydrogenase-like predicted oxidoreductase
MRTLESLLTTAPASIVGFGCASLGSRIGRPAGLAALGRAADAGITWFDVAPPYGDGLAEEIVGEFAVNRRDTLNICTKVGLSARISWGKALARPLARAIVAGMPGLRSLAARARKVDRLQLTPGLLVESAENSLRRLGTDTLDALLLHEPSIEDVCQPDLQEALQKLKSSGKVRLLGVAGTFEAAECASRFPDLYSVLQFAHNAIDPRLDAPWLATWRAARRLVVTHTSLGGVGGISAVAQQITRNGLLRDLLRDAGYSGSPATMAASCLIDFALETNRGGIVLFSMMQPSHLAEVTSRTNAPRRSTDWFPELRRSLAALPSRPH